MSYDTHPQISNVFRSKRVIENPTPHTPICYGKTYERWSISSCRYHFRRRLWEYHVASLTAICLYI